jgi:amino acid adenylation domain-containing protein
MSEIKIHLETVLHRHDAAGSRTAQVVNTLPAMLLAMSKGRRRDVAIADDDGEFTYEDTLLRAISIAAALRSQGTSYNDCIGLFIDSSADLPMAMWGILFCGAAYLPLATDYPPERLAYMVKDAAVQVIVTNNKTVARLEGLLLPGVRVVNIDHIAPPEAAQTDRILSELAEQAGDDLAYVIYTSGTTGKPKGVAISHQAIVNQMSWIAREGYLGSGQSILQKTPVSFDAAQWELLGVCCGAKVVMGLPGIYRDPEGLIRQIRAHGVTTLQGVPTLWQALSELPEFGSCTSLRHMFSGGEGLSRKLAKNLRQIFPHNCLVNLYGPTECTINSTHFRIDEDCFDNEWEIAPIGLPVAGLACHVLDQDCAPVARGQVGELFISGGQLSHGYLFRPEQTEEKFPQLNLPASRVPVRLYRTGDLVKQDPCGVLHFVGRIDNQVKFRGYRIELDEIRLAIENHDWVKSAAVFVKENERTGHAQLIGCVELNPNEARLMDQGAAESHHQTKSTRVQTKAQLSGRGCRADETLCGKATVELAGRQETAAQRARVFARKTYRFFHGGAVVAGDIAQLLALPGEPGQSAPLAALDGDRLGAMLRYLGQFISDERLLPKFGYASPGALYAAQVYLELNNIAGLACGYYYYHPLRHSLTLLTATATVAPACRLRLHFVGKVEAIREVYKNNILEVLEMETGHILGMLDHVLPEYGYGIGQGACRPEVMAHLDCPPEHAYLASVDIVPLAARIDALAVDVYVQAHQDKVADLDNGTYLYQHGQLHKVSDFLVEQRHVIAINQQVYQRSSAGISFVSRASDAWRHYIDLGRSLQRLQMNRIGVGTMSSGYSSKSGNNLATACRLDDILEQAGHQAGPSYFCLLGSISAEQAQHVGMDEDAVHMKGPAELIRADLYNALPDYMVPGRIVIVNKMPHSSSGKVDVAALKHSEAFQLSDKERALLAPRNNVEAGIAMIWHAILGLEQVSVDDDFFELGGNSIQAVAITRAINRQFAASLPIQAIFSAPTVEQLALSVSGGDARKVSRAIRLAGEGAGRTVFCWPGLGGYPMNLRQLGEAVTTDGRFYGTQSRGINAGETPFDSIEAMAAEDVELIRAIAPHGPYTLWGYSFGARVAYEVAYQLEQMGESVERLVLLAPGSPLLPYAEPVSRDEAVLFANPAFLTILLSVFSHEIDPSLSSECRVTVHSRAAFVDFATAKFPSMDASLINAIIDVVAVSYSPNYQIALADKKLSCPVEVWRANGDGDSFVANAHDIGLKVRYHDLAVGHYALLKPEGITEMLAAGLA